MKTSCYVKQEKMLLEIVNVTEAFACRCSQIFLILGGTEEKANRKSCSTERRDPLLLFM